MGTDKSGKADAIIATAVVGTAAMGGLPVLIDVGPLLAANGAMIASLALLYGLPWGEGDTKEFVRMLTHAVAAKVVVLGSIKLMWSAIAFTGVGLGGALAMNAATNALVTLGFGRAAKLYFENDGKVEDHEVITVLANTLTLGGFKEVARMLRSK